MDVETIRSSLAEALAALLAPVPLADLAVVPDLDHDGDPILRVQAVYDDGAGDVSGRQYVDAIGLVQDRLRAIGEPRFGHLTFMALSERNEAA